MEILIASDFSGADGQSVERLCKADSNRSGLLDLFMPLFAIFGIALLWALFLSSDRDNRVTTASLGGGFYHLASSHVDPSRFDSRRIDERRFDARRIDMRRFDARRVDPRRSSHQVMQKHWNTLAEVSQKQPSAPLELAAKGSDIEFVYRAGRPAADMSCDSTFQIDNDTIYMVSVSDANRLAVRTNRS